MVLAAMGVAAFSGAQAQPQSAPPAGTQPRVEKYQSAKKAHTQDEGERVFQQNCSRCHATPEGFSSRISGTIVRHMRVRANLSQHDEQVLLKYLNQ